MRTTMWTCVREECPWYRCICCRTFSRLLSSCSYEICSQHLTPGGIFPRFPDSDIGNRLLCSVFSWCWCWSPMLIRYLWVWHWERYPCLSARKSWNTSVPHACHGWLFSCRCEIAPSHKNSPELYWSSWRASNWYILEGCMNRGRIRCCMY